MVTRFDFDRYLDAFRNASNDDALHGVMEMLTRDLGFQQFAMGHHVDLVRPPRSAIKITNYNPRWIERSLGEGYYLDDPVHVASSRSGVGFFWHEIGQIVHPTERHAHILAQAEPYGLGAGLTVPAVILGEFAGSCSFGAPSLERVRRHALPLAQMAVSWAFESARRIMRRRDGLVFEKPPEITRRERESLVLMAQGKTDREIGMIMGISHHTAHEHVERVRHAYGNAQRQYLVPRTLFDGVISFPEILRP